MLFMWPDNYKTETNNWTKHFLKKPKITAKLKSIHFNWIQDASYAKVSGTEEIKNLLAWSLGYSGPYIIARSFADNATLTRYHWMTNASWCLQLAHISLKVFHSGGEGKYLVQARSHISNRTLNTLLHNWSPIPSENKSIMGEISNMVFSCAQAQPRITRPIFVHCLFCYMRRILREHMYVAIKISR